MTQRIVIVGAGAAGVFTAYRVREMYGDDFEIELLEGRPQIGGNTYTTSVDFGGKTYSIDAGAQFFYKNSQVSYVELIEKLGLFAEDDSNEIISTPAGFTIWDRGAGERVFYVPSRIGGLLKYGLQDWERLTQFGMFLAYSYFLDRGNQPWTLSVNDWFAGLDLLSEDFKQKVLMPFFYQFCTLPLGRMGEASARYAVTYMVRNVFGEPGVDEPDTDPPSLPGLPVFETYQSLIGLDGIMKVALEQANVVPKVNCRVMRVAKVADGWTVDTNAGPIHADHIVLACDPLTSAAILRAGGTTPETLLTTLDAMEYDDLPLSIQNGGDCHMPADRDYWQPINTIVDGDDLVFTAWFGPLRETYGFPPKQIPVFKSWGTPDLIAPACEHEFLVHHHRITQPTTAFMAAREALHGMQGTDGLWFAGGWTNWFDSQEAALDSATAVAQALTSDATASTFSPPQVPVDHDQNERNIRRWLERVSSQAPDEEKKKKLANALDDVAQGG